jgi:hypothetical protein
MAYYRLYFWGRNRIAGFEDFFADDDAGAIEIAPSYARGLDMELWTESRLVASFQAEQRTG